MDQTNKKKQVSVEQTQENTDQPSEISTESQDQTRKSLGRVLLIEDDPPMVKMYSTKLQMEGFEVEVAYDGEKGLEKTEEWKPDLVVLDLMIPKMGGMDVLKQIRANPKTKNVPVLILSNLSQEQDVQLAKELKVKEFLVKANFTPGQVVEKIKQSLT